MLNIKHFKDEVLYSKAREVSEVEFGEELEAFMSEMATTMYGSTGVGLAGPQVGDSRRILVADLSYVVGAKYGAELVKMVNPTIVSYSAEEEIADEGCISYPGLAVKVSRPLAAHVKFFSPLGDEQSVTLNGWQARIVLHEIDHLNGVTLYTRASSYSQSRYRKIQIKRGNVAKG